MPNDPSFTRSARYDRETIIERLVDTLPDQVQDALSGDQGALVTLLEVAADVGWQERSHDTAHVENLPVAAYSLAEDITDCYATGASPSDRLSEDAFALAERVDALALEVVLLRHEAGSRDLDLPPIPTDSTVRGIRHQMRAHVIALRAGTAHRRRIQQPDVQAAQDLYDSLVALERRVRADQVREAIARTTADPSAGNRDP